MTVYNENIRAIPKWWVSVLILLCFVSLNASTLNSYNFHRAEGNTLKHFGEQFDHTLPQVVASIAKNSEDHVPAYFLVLGIWLRFVGAHPVMLSILSIYLGVLSFATIYHLGKKINRQHGGNLVVFLFAFSALPLFHFHQIRMYPMLMFFEPLVLLSYWNIISRKEKVRLRDWVFLYLASILFLYTHLSSVFILVALGIYHLLFVTKNRQWWTVGLVEALVGISFIPWLPMAIRGVIDPPSLAEHGTLFNKIYNVLFTSSNGLWWLTLAMLIICIIFAKRLTPVQRFLSTLGIGGLFVFFTIDTIMGIFSYKYTIVLLPSLFLAITVGVIKIYHIRSQLLAIIVILWLGMFTWYYRSPALDPIVLNDEPSQWPPFYRLFSTDIPYPPNSEDLPVVGLNDEVFVTRKSQQYFDWYFKRDFYYLVNNDRSSSYFELNLRRLQGRHDLFFILYSPHQTAIETHKAYETLSENFRSCNNLIDEPEVRFEYWVRQNIPCELVTPDSTPLIRYDNGIELYNALAEVREGMIHIYTWWDHLPDESYGYSIQIFDSANNKVAQSDTLLPTKAITEYTFDVSELGDETYRVDMIVYDSATVTSLAGTIITVDTTFDRAFTISEVVISN